MAMGSWTPLHTSSLGLWDLTFPAPNSTQPSWGPPECLLLAGCRGHHGWNMAQLMEGVGQGRLPGGRDARARVKE